MLARLIAELCLLRAKPQDLPASPILLVGALGAHFALDVLTLVDAYPVAAALVGAAVDTLLLVAVTHTVLMLRNLGSRTLQTLSALALIGAVFSAAAWSATAMLANALPPVAIWGAFLLWYLLVFGHIARHALSVPLAAGVAIALGYFLLSVLITGSMMGAPPTELANGAPR